MFYTVKVIQMSKRCNQIEHHFYTIFAHRNTFQNLNCAVILEGMTIFRSLIFSRPPVRHGHL